MAFSTEDYEFLDEIGRGTFGSVMRARQKSLGRLVAIKSLMPHRTQNRRDILRFRQEAEAMAALSHDNIISVLDYAFADGTYYIVMEYVKGVALEEALERGLSRPASLLVVEKVVDALGCAHASGVIHRDIKPGNILLGMHGRVKLADFGLAAFRKDLSTSSSHAAVGTISYMAPEAIVDPATADARVDVFAVGCILYRIFSGGLPFDGSNIGEVSYKLLNESPRPLKTAKGSDGVLEELILRCLARDRDRRPGTGELHRALADRLGDRRRGAQEELSACVAGASPGGVPPAAGPGEPANNAVPARVRLSPSGRRLIAAACAVPAVSIGLYFFLGRTRRTAPLPRPESIGGSEAPAAFGRGAPPPAGRADPEPLTQSGTDLNVATLMIAGLQPSDSLFINGRRVVLPPDRRFLGFPLAPGTNRLELRREGGVTLKRTFRVRPLAVVSWNINEKGTTDDGGSSPRNRR